MTKKTKQSQKSKKSSLITKAGLALVLIGLVVGAINILGIWHSQRSAARLQPLAKVLNNHKPAENDQPIVSGTPTHISVPSVGIDINVIPGYYYSKTKSWTLSNNNAQYGVITPKANNKSGDTFIYGHALMNVFGRLPAVKPGDKAIITTDNGHTFTYQFQVSSITSPGDTSLFSYKGRPVLILQTCTGVWYQNRQLFVFDFSGVS
jgi:LPXTG-site transpeptidase (sortase) family protein